MAKDLTVSIVAHNDRPHVEECLRSLFETTQDVDFHAIVVDNASVDGLGQWLGQHYPQVEYIRNEANLFFTRAHNQALRRAQTPYVLVLNPDITIHPGAIASMMSYLRGHPEIGVLGARLLHPDGTFQDPRSRHHRFLWVFWQMALLGAFFKPSFIQRLRNYQDDPQSPQEVDAVIGACMLMPKRALDAVGLFDEGFWIYSEEQDLCLRMQQAGWRVVYFPQAVMTHIWQATTRRNPRLMMRRIEWNSFLHYFHKHRSWLAWAVLRTVSWITFPMLALKESFKKPPTQSSAA